MTVKPSKPVKQQTNPPPKQQLAVNAPQQQPATTSDEALDRHLAEWGGSGGPLVAFNGSTGIHRTLDDNVEVPDGTEFVMHLHETRKGFIKFNPDGPPDVHMVKIDEDADIERESLGDLDSTKWPNGLSGKKEDPFKEQFAIPMERYDAGRALHVYVARGPVAMNSVRNLLSAWRYHPKRKAGLIPVVKIKNGTYFSKRFNENKPKPAFEFVTWVTKAGETPPSSQPSLPSPSLKEELNDDLPNFVK